MVIKEIGSRYDYAAYLNKYKCTFTNYSRIKWLVLLIIIFILIVGMNLASIYYGMVLKKTGKSMTLTRWASSLVHHKLSFIPNYFNGLMAQPEHIDIDIKFKNFQQIAHKRQEAFKAGVLISSPTDWVSAKIRYKGETYRVNMRLKGDTPDHWKRDDRWSYKIKMKDNKTLFGMKRFAIQDPRTREYLNEWVFHKLLGYSGLIHLRYDFIDVSINGKHQPIYALEENFSKELIENNGLREGPLFRFTSGYNWSDKIGLLPILYGASIDPYQQKKMVDDSNLAIQFNKAKNLLELYRRNKLPASEVFDADKLSKLFALADLLGHHHALSLDNLKFYYNPVTSLIEPVAYDFHEFLPLTDLGLRGAGKKLELDFSVKVHYERFRDNIFKDPVFFQKYIKSLDEISDKSFLDDFFSGINEELQEKLGILHVSYPWYNFDQKPILYKNQKYIKDYLYPSRSLQAYFKDFSTKENTLSLKIRNVHTLPVKIMDTVINDSIILKPFQDTVLQAASSSEPISDLTVKFKGPESLIWSDSMISTLKIRHKVIGSHDVSHDSVHPWQDLDSNFLANDFIRQKPNIMNFDFLAVDNEAKTISFKPGNWQLEQNLIIPEGYLVIATGGLKVDILNAAKILSYSPVSFIGSSESPILFHSSDLTGQGFTVLNADKYSLLTHVIFENLSNPDQSGWILTGAVTFYESPVKISHCRFDSNRSEDALNIIRSDFEISNTLFSETLSDAFDGDFVKGSIINSTFVDSGNDAIDVSGSVVKLEKIFINGVGDKGISAGENSRLTASQVEIENAELAITSKDLSEVNIDSINLNNSRVGFTAYQKKSVFGPAMIMAKNLTLTNVRHPYLIESGSNLILENKPVKSNKDNVKSILYGVEFGKSSK